jgi:hypothetical protein
MFSFTFLWLAPLWRLNFFIRSLGVMTVSSSLGSEVLVKAPGTWIHSGVAERRQRVASQTAWQGLPKSDPGSPFGFQPQMYLRTPTDQLYMLSGAPNLSS